ATKSEPMAFLDPGNADLTRKVRQRDERRCLVTVSMRKEAFYFARGQGEPLTPPGVGPMDGTSLLQSLRSFEPNAGMKRG
ncbi:hypothetical protein ACM41_05275, partial [Bradyrhizobium sp. CCBAU 21362]|uniref:hypothetical protein n=1 Tax=Bradyrhizobium sp. CCBAU 21362 TaxID=1325082 RepID=UPI002FE04389|nr:hypothetical protein [Bradyrhizobium sp. CCBAU 21362]